MMFILLVTLTCVVSLTSSCQQPVWSNQLDAMTNSVRWYSYLMGVDYGFQTDTIRCNTFLPVQHDQNRDHFTVYTTWVDNKDQPQSNVWTANETAKNSGVFASTIDLKGQEYHFNISVICGEMGFVKGKLAAIASCDPTSGKMAFWLMFDTRRTKSTITPEDQIRVTKCLKRNNIDISKLTYTQNDKCPNDA